ncbi:Hint domain-containing protein [Thalassobius sp. I31.1]|uniref:Hint domain-containing protein n=1 Tax=Thalassobius sp. I31.1 TaxID=2109912 RepID=UPI000D1BD1F9|nr:Hint domain-containing protein [Thalassobius sp. I31.1]
MATIDFAILLANGSQTIVDDDGQSVTITATFTSDFFVNGSGDVQTDNAVDTDADSFTLTFSNPVENLTFTVGDVNSNGFQGGFNDRMVVESTLNGTPVVTTLSSGTSGTTAVYEAPFDTNITQTVTVAGPFDQITLTNVDPDQQHGWLFLNTAEVQNVVCFTAGTLIATRNGQTAIENLKPGDLIMTRDRGFQPLRWIGKKEITPAMLRRNEKLRPVRIKAGALARDLPVRDLQVSRQHRMLAVSRISERMFGAEEVLIAAIKLTELPGIDVAPVEGPVTYFHMLFEQHEIVYAEGTPTESLHTGTEAMKTLPHASVEEISILFPELMGGEISRPAARIIPDGKRQKQFVSRTVKNNRPLVSQPV